LAATHYKQVTIDTASGDYDVYVLLTKGGKVSAPIKINTNGGTEVGGEFGDGEGGDDEDDPDAPDYALHMKLYVASYGDDSNSGDIEEPLATVQKALEKLRDAYAWSWPDKGTDDEARGRIIILDTVLVTEKILIKGSVGYPRIVLSDEWYGGTLQATLSIVNKIILELVPHKA
jgi:hypothetical protein